MGLGVRLGTTDVSRPKVSASADLLKFAFIMNPYMKIPNSVKWRIIKPKSADVVYTETPVSATFFQESNAAEGNIFCLGSNKPG